MVYDGIWVGAGSKVPNVIGDFDRWVEYCNSHAGSTTLAGPRASAGYAQPLEVRYWGIGNESWRCGGNFTPAEYATAFHRFVTWVPKFGMKELSFIASGSNGVDWDWTCAFLQGLLQKGPDQPRSVFGHSL